MSTSCLDGACLPPPLRPARLIKGGYPSSKMITRWIAVILGLLLFLVASAQAQSIGGVSEAERLEAHVLAENLRDFAARTGSARAYLMAAELTVLYPSKESETSTDLWLGKACQLSPEEPVVRLWVEELRALAVDSPASVVRVESSPDFGHKWEESPTVAAVWILEQAKEAAVGSWRAFGRLTTAREPVGEDGKNS